MKKILFNTELIKFLIIGGGAALIYLITQYVSHIYYNREPILAGSNAFIISAIFSYIANSIYTFKEKLGVNKAIKFFIITTLGYLLNISIVYIVEELMMQSFYASFVIVHLTVPFFNFIGHKIWTFKTVTQA